MTWMRILNDHELDTASGADVGGTSAAPSYSSQSLSSSILKMLEDAAAAAAQQRPQTAPAADAGQADPSAAFAQQ